MASLYDTLFSPLGEEYCNIVLVLTMFAFLGLVSVVLSTILKIVTGELKGFKILIASFALLYSFLTYVLFRLAYSVCKGAL